MAIVSLTLSIIGIVSLVFFFVNQICRHYGPVIAFVAIITGHIAYTRIKKNIDLSGKWIALTGLLVGYINLLLVGLILIFGHYYSKALYDHYRKYCLETIVLYCDEYVSKNNGDLPVSLEFLLSKHTSNPDDFLISPVTKVHDKFSYKLNISGNIKDYPDKSNTVMIIEVTPNTRDNKIVAFLDGRIEVVDNGRFTQLTNHSYKVKTETNEKNIK